MAEVKRNNWDHPSQRTRGAFAFEVRRHMFERQMILDELVLMIRVYGRRITRAAIKRIFEKRRRIYPKMIDAFAQALGLGVEEGQMLHRAAAYDAGFEIGDYRLGGSRRPKHHKHTRTVTSGGVHVVNSGIKGSRQWREHRRHAWATLEARSRQAGRHVAPFSADEQEYGSGEGQEELASVVRAGENTCNTLHTASVRFRRATQEGFPLPIADQ